jgi:hypothetical protein
VLEEMSSNPDIVYTDRSGRRRFRDYLGNVIAVMTSLNHTVITID